jgi:hypothetical protein
MLKPFVNSLDHGPLILSHIYLVFAIAIPIWLSPSNLVKAFSGIISIGVADSIVTLNHLSYSGVCIWNQVREN